MRVLITGATGFVGGHLAEALLPRAGSVFGLSRRGEWPAEWSHLSAHVPLRGCDLLDLSDVRAALAEAAPDQIYHLAGYASTGGSFREPFAAWAGNLTAMLNVYEAVARGGTRPRILYVGSGLIYGDPLADDQLVNEDSPLHPSSPYAASKAAADLAGYQYARTHNLAVIRARPFNHIGPRQSPHFAVASFAQQLVEIERGRQPPVLHTGDLSHRRDLTDVRDMVRAYLLLMERGRPGEAYNIGSGEVYAMSEVVNRLQKAARLNVRVAQQADRVRPGDTAVTRADSRKIRAETGWSPQFTLDQTLRDTLDYWRQADPPEGSA